MISSIPMNSITDFKVNYALYSFPNSCLVFWSGHTIEINRKEQVSAIISFPYYPPRRGKIAYDSSQIEGECKIRS